MLGVYNYLLIACFGNDTAANAEKASYALELPGFSKVCQEAAAMTAMSKIENKALSQLKRLLVNKDAVDVVHWGNKVASVYPKTEEYHYQRVKYFEDALNETGHPKCGNITMDNIDQCSSEHCLLKAINHFYTMIADPSQLSKYPLLYPPDMKFTDVDALKFVINLVTELHNPAAFSMAGETKLQVHHGHLALDANTSIKTTAYELARGQACDIYADKYTSHWNSGWTHYRSLGLGFYQSAVTEFGTTLEENLAAFKKWGVETAANRCAFMTLYPHGFNLGQREVDANYRNHMRNLVLKAGVRMSVVIQKILDVQKAGGLRKGSGIDVPVEVSYGRGSHEQVIRNIHNETSKFQILFINVGVIAVIVFFGWLLLIRDPNAAESVAYGTGANDSKKQQPAASNTSGISMSQMLGKDKSN